jgi:lysophospholipase L1-like esterase
MPSSATRRPLPWSRALAVVKSPLKRPALSLSLAFLAVSLWTFHSSALCGFSLPEFLYSRIAASSDDYILFDGDSITKGKGAFLGINLPLQAVLSLSKSVAFTNTGICGLQLAEMNARRAKVVVPRLKHNILVTDGGSNDLDKIPGDKLFSEFLLPYIRYARARGFTIIVGTLIYRNNLTPEHEKERQIYNDLVRANQKRYGYEVVDYDSIPELRYPQNPSATADGVHPSRYGYKLMALLLAPILNSQL